MRKNEQDRLKELSKDENPLLRCLVAGNPNIPLETLKELSKDERWNVRWGVANNPNTPIKILKELLKDEHWEVRKTVAAHPNISINMLKELSKDENLRVRIIVADRLKDYECLIFAIENNNPALINAIPSKCDNKRGEQKIQLKDIVNADVIADTLYIAMDFCDNYPISKSTVYAIEKAARLKYNEPDFSFKNMTGNDIKRYAKKDAAMKE